MALLNGTPFSTWVERGGTRHVRVKQLELREVRDGDRIVNHLRGFEQATPEDMAELIALAAENAAQLAELILKIALVQQETMQRTDKPIGEDVVICMQSVLDNLMQAPQARTEDRWPYLARTLEAMEACVLEKLQTFTGGNDEDTQIVRAGVGAMQHDLEGEALKREYEQKRTALADVELRIERFFKKASRGATPRSGA